MCSFGKSHFAPFRPIDVREKVVMDRVLSGQDKGDAYADAGLPATNNPEGRVDSIMKKPQNQEYISRVLDEAGATDEKIAEVLAKGMDAESVQYRKHIKMITVRGSRGDKQRRIEEIVPLHHPNHAERRMSAMAVAELKGYKGGKQDDGGGAIVRVYAPFTPKPKGERGENDMPGGIAIEVKT